MSETDLIERTYRAYFTVFQMGDARAITPYFHVPSLFVLADGTHATNNVREVEQYLERLLYSLRQRGYTRSVLSEIQVRPLADDLALVNARADRFTRSGDLLEQVSALYTFRKTTGTWRIASMTTYEPTLFLDLH